MILVVGFSILAMKNWSTSIGAGPTILIVGAIVLSVFGAVKWADFQQKIREYDTCVQRVERSSEAYLFNNTLVIIIEREIPDGTIGRELREVLLDPLTLNDCPPEPSFLDDFTEELVSDRNK